MRKLKVTRYKQKPGHCAIAACATVGNSHNQGIDYEQSQEIAKKKVVKNIDEGLDSGEIGSLLNHLGFQKVTVVTTNLHIFDYSWNKYKKNHLISTMKEMGKFYKGEYREVLKSLRKWLELEQFDNNIIIDYDFSKYIRQTLDNKNPLVLSFNWTMYFKYTKQGETKLDSIKGEMEEHAVVAYGYSKKGVYICDSHHECYKYKLKRYRSGLYVIPWEHLMTIMGLGDLYIPECYE
jgi:hypothetical protein